MNQTCMCRDESNFSKEEFNTQEEGEEGDCDN
jgi:hypothetical protein